jgi:hypothetical protein
MRRRRLLAALLALASSQAFSHGDEAPGPNNGVVRMPGAFHVEVVQQGSNHFDVFLLDMEFKNPVTDKSEVKAFLQNKTKVTISCTPREKFFRCSIPKDADLKSGVLEIAAVRKGVPGVVVNYPLPLK